MPITRIDGTGVDFGSVGLASPSITSGDLVLNRINDGFDFSVVLSTAANNLNRNVIFQRAGGGAINGFWQFRGEVVMPDQVYVYARVGSGGAYNLNTADSPHVMRYNSAPVNTLSAFNTSNYRFTAPIAGRYLVMAHTQINGTSTGSWAYNFGVWKNGSIQDGVYESANGSTYIKLSVTSIITCAVNDFIDIRLLINVSSGSIEYSSPDQRHMLHIYHLG